MTKKQSTFFICLLSVGLFLLGGCEKKSTNEKAPIKPLANVTVSTTNVLKKIAHNQVEVVGTVQAVLQSQISAKISGNIISLPVDLGSRVKQGDALAELSAGEISAQVQQAKAHLEQARRNLAREENLLKKNAATPETVKTFEDSARISEAAYREALTMLDYTKITAPFTGIVTRKFVNIGDLATPGKPLLNIEEEHRLQVLTDIPEALIQKVNKGDRLKVSIPSASLELEGVVAEVSPTADPSSRSAPIKLRIPSDPKLRSGQFARVTLALAKEETLMIPAVAVTTFGQMERAYVVNGGKASLRLIRTGIRIADHLEILSGLNEGETVITAGHQSIVDGQPVTAQ